MHTWPADEIGLRIQILYLTSPLSLTLQHELNLRQMNCHNHAANRETRPLENKSELHDVWTLSTPRVFPESLTRIDVHEINVCVRCRLREARSAHHAI